jgi:hypothetical protein
LGTASGPMLEPPGPSGRATAAFGRLWVITYHPPGERSAREPDPVYAATTMPATGGFFQRPQPKGDVAQSRRTRHAAAGPGRVGRRVMGRRSTARWRLRPSRARRRGRTPRRWGTA